MKLETLNRVLLTVNLVTQPMILGMMSAIIYLKGATGFRVALLVSIAALYLCNLVEATKKEPPAKWKNKGG